MQHTPHNITSDMTSIFLIAMNWTSLILSAHPLATEWLQLAGLILGVIASGVVVADHCLKIHWKIKQYKKQNKDERNNRSTEG